MRSHLNQPVGVTAALQDQSLKGQLGVTAKLRDHKHAFPLSLLSSILSFVKNHKDTQTRHWNEKKKNWSSPSIFYNLYMLGNRPNTCSCHSCRRPNISVMHPFPDKRGEEKKRSGQALKEQVCVIKLGGTCVFCKLTWMHGFISWFLNFRVFLSIWTCEDFDKSCA